jgi:hypothetical protein
MFLTVLFGKSYHTNQPKQFTYLPTNQPKQFTYLPTYLPTYRFSVFRRMSSDNKNNSNLFEMKAPPLVLQDHYVDEYGILHDLNLDMPPLVRQTNDKQDRKLLVGDAPPDSLPEGSPKDPKQ